MKTREEIIRDNPLEPYLTSIGVKLIGNGKERMCCCPVHQDKTPSCQVNVETNLWRCYGCNQKGSIIDLMALVENVPVGAIMKRLGEVPEGFKPAYRRTETVRETSSETAGNSKPVGKEKPTVTYDYRNEQGELVYQVCRYEPKTFRQRRPVVTEDGRRVWAYNMDGVERVIYQLPQVLKTQKPICICEGEKDANNITLLGGWVGTTNVGGAGKWLDAYSEYLTGKEIILCGDNDKPGKEHMDKVLASLAGKAKVVRVVKIPEKFKDVTEWLNYMNGPAWDMEASHAAFSKLVEEAPAFDKGLNLPLKTYGELEVEFIQLLKVSQQRSLDFKKWLPGLAKVVQPMVPGEVVTILAASKVGKTAIAANLMMHAAPLKVINFQQELPGSLTFQRSVAMATGIPAREVWHKYISGHKDEVDWRGTGKLDHIIHCHRTRMTPDQIEKLIVQSELKLGEMPAMFVVDYLQLCGGKGERGDRIADAAEGMKVIAKNTGTICVMLSQRGRAGDINKKDDRFIEPRLTDGKFAGEIENSSGLIMGAWQSEQDQGLLNIRVLGNTKGFPGALIECDFDGERMLISERSKIPKEVPINN